MTKMKYAFIVLPSKNDAYVDGLNVVKVVIPDVVVGAIWPSIIGREVFGVEPDVMAAFVPVAVIVVESVVNELIENILVSLGTTFEVNV